MNRLFKALSLVVIATLSLVLAAPSFAADPVNTLEKKLLGYRASGVAILGYDTVAYFTQGSPVEGSDAFTTQWNEATWRFSSQEHLDLFEADPEKYAPQYGGYCAYGVAQDYLVKIDPAAWTITDDKLYLNYDTGVQKKWEQDIPGFIAKADERFGPLITAQ